MPLRGVVCTSRVSLVIGNAQSDLCRGLFISVHAATAADNAAPAADNAPQAQLLVGAQKRFRLAERLRHPQSAADVVQRDLAGGQRRAKLHVGLPLSAVAVADV